MKILATLMLATIIALLPLPLSSSSSCDVVRYGMDLRSCFKIHKVGEEVTINSKESFLETSLQVEGMFGDPQKICSKNESLRALLDCLEGTTTKCMTSDEEKSYVPDASLTKEGLDYFCQHADEIDQGCYNQSYSEVFGCVNALSGKHLKSNDSASTRACTTVDMTHDCIHEHVTCDEKTRDLLLKFQDEYRKPKSCPAPTRSNRKKYINSAGSSIAVFVSKLFCVCLSFCLILVFTD